MNFGMKIQSLTGILTMKKTPVGEPLKNVEGIFSNISGFPNGSVLEKSSMVRFLLMKNLGMKE